MRSGVAVAAVMALAVFCTVRAQQGGLATSTPEGTVLETNLPMRFDNDGCPTMTRVACSGHGKCLYSHAAFWGMAQQHSLKKKCECHPGWYGTACQLTLADYSDQLELRKALSALAGNVPPSPPGVPLPKRDPETSFMRQLDDNGVPSVPKTASVKRGSDLAVDQSAESPVDAWSQPPSSDFNPGGQMLAKFERERTIITIAPKVPEKRQLFDAESSRTMMALYTSDAGDSLIAPTIYPGQEGFHLVMSSDVKKDDPTVQKLVDTLNQLYKSKQSS